MFNIIVKSTKYEKIKLMDWWKIFLAILQVETYNEDLKKELEWLDEE